MGEAALPIMDLRSYAKTFPSQGGAEIGEWLEAYASVVPKGLAIVELGCWLGAGTAQLALGAQESGAPIHVYDRWMASTKEVLKAHTYGVELPLGGNTLPRVEQALEPFGVDITYHRGDLRLAQWYGGPIGLYVDDATKIETIWRRAMDVFGPHFVSHETILVLMDYYFFEKAGDAYAAQKRYMAEHVDSFELLAERMGGTTAAIFRFLG